MGALPFEVLYRPRHRQLRRDPADAHGHGYRSSVDRHLVATADFPQQFPGSQPDIPNQHRVSVLGHPYDVIFAVPYRMTAGFRRLHNKGCYRIPLPEGEGFTDPEKGTLNDSGVVVIVGSGAGGGTLGNELAQKGVKVVILEPGARKIGRAHV